MQQAALTVEKVKMKPFFVVAWLIIVIVILSACGSDKSPEDQVRHFIATGVAAAESRDVLAFRDLVSDNYKDVGNRDRRSLVGLATGYFLRHKNIHLFTQISEISFPSVGQSQVKVFIAMAGSPVSGAEALLDLRADLYQFDLVLLREGDEWLLQKAQWQRASIDDLLEN